MKGFIIKAIIKVCAKSIALTATIGVIIAIIGYVNKWTSTIAYSNAFFIAGVLMIIAGTSSRYASGLDWNRFQLLNADSFRDMSSIERVLFIINENSPISLVILGILSGISLIVMSAIAAYAF